MLVTHLNALWSLPGNVCKQLNGEQGYDILAINYLKHSSCSDFNRLIFGSVANTEWMALFPSSAGIAKLQLWNNAENWPHQSQLLLLGDWFSCSSTKMKVNWEKSLKEDENWEEMCGHWPGYHCPEKLQIWAVVVVSFYKSLYCC